MRKTKGFTLVELLVVIAIIGILAVLVLLALGGARRSARDASRKSIANNIATANELYYDSYSAYAGSVGDAGGVADCTGAAADSLVGVDPPLMGCPGTSAYSGGAEVTWNSIYAAAGSTWSMTTDLEGGGTFTCSEGGCAE